MSKEISISVQVAEIENLFNRMLTWHSDVTSRAWDTSSGQTSPNSGRQVTDSGHKRLIARRNCLSALLPSN